MGRKKHRNRARREHPALSVHERPTLNPSAPPVALSIAPDPEAIFFAEPTPEPMVLTDETAERVKRITFASSRSPGSRFLPMVKIVVTACALLIFVGGVRSAVAHSHRADQGSTRSISNSPAAAASPPTPVNSAVFEAATNSPPPDSTSDVDPILAREKTNASQAKLEVGAVKASIDLGEEAVRLDPTSARAWLVLGAAYQQHADTKNAWRCYRTCTNQGEGKERVECASML